MKRATLMRNAGLSSFFRCLVASVLIVLSAHDGTAEETLDLQTLINEALRNNHELLVAQSRWNAALDRIPQAESLPDPMVMVGYQNEGWDRYTYGQMLGSQWMYSASQMFPFPGKRTIRGEIATRNAESAEEAIRAARLNTVARVKELYYELFLAYRDIDLVKDKTDLFSLIEEAALGRYAAGTGSQTEVLMAQTEKYMLSEKETMFRQKVRSGQLMLASVLGASSYSLEGKKPAEHASSFPYSLDELVQAALERSPEVRSRVQMRDAAESKVHLSEKEYYPDITLAARVDQRSGPFEDMWSVTATFNIPLYLKTKRSAEAEANAQYREAIHDLAGTKLMLDSGIRDDYSMMQTSEKLMNLYREGLIPKTRQNFESALAGYRTGKVEAAAVIGQLKTLLDYETQYWEQFVAREKAIARLEAVTAITEPAVKNDENN